MSKTHPLYEEQGPEGYGYAAPPRSTEFFHASNRPLKGEVSWQARRGTSSGSRDDVNWFSSDQRNVRGYGRKYVYRVTPTGSFTHNWDSAHPNEFESEHPLRILNQVQFDG